MRTKKGWSKRMGKKSMTNKIRDNSKTNSNSNK